MAGMGGVVGGKWRQLYLNNNKKTFKNIILKIPKKVMTVLNNRKIPGKFSNIRKLNNVLINYRSNKKLKRSLESILKLIKNITSKFVGCSKSTLRGKIWNQ